MFYWNIVDLQYYVNFSCLFYLFIYFFVYFFYLRMEQGSRSTCESFRLGIQEHKKTKAKF